MKRATTCGLVLALLALSAVTPSCATGDDGTTAEVSTTTPSAGDGGAGGPDAACPPCGAGLTCSSGACVSVDTDGDGVPASKDCDDHDPAVHPGAAEVCNGKDDDCNGSIDELPTNLTGSLVAPVNTHWALAGSASIVNGWAQLTQDVPYQSGALWWNAPYTFDTFDVSATFWIQSKASGADGMTFAWVPGNAVSVVGNGASTFGIGNLAGYAVVIDTFLNANEPAVPFLAVVQNAAAPITLSRAAIPNVHDSLNHRLRVRLDAGKVSVWVDGINYLFEFPIVGYAPFSGHWGFTGGTGAASEAHWVSDVTMSFPNGQGCVP